MGMHTNKKIGASILITMMLLASLTGLIGSGVMDSDPLVSAEPIDLSRQITSDRIPMKTGSTVLDSTPGIRQLTEYRADYKASEGENVILAAAEPLQINSLFPDVDTGRTVLLEIASGIDNGSFVPAYLYAGNQAAAYSRNDVALMELNSWMDGNIVAATYWGLQDKEFAPGEFNWLLGGDPADDAAMREYYTAPYGLDTFPAYLNSDTAGDPNDLMNAGGFAIDGGFAGKYDGSGAFYSDCDSTSTGRWDGAGGAVPEFIQDDLDARIATPSDLTMTLNGSYDDVLEEGTFSLAISSIGNMGDLGYDSNKFVTTFFIVDDYNTVVTRNNALGPTGPGYTVKDYNIRYSMQQWVGTDEALDGSLDSRGETVTYQDVAFSRNPTVRAANLGGGAMPAWNLNELGVIAAIYDEETMEVHQAVYYDFADNTPDIAIQATDVSYGLPPVAVVNETVFGPTSVGQTTFNIGYTNIIDCTLYVDEDEFASTPFDWYKLWEVGAGGWDDYTLDYDTGDVYLEYEWWADTSYIHGWLNYSATPNSGDIVPVHISIDNAGRSSSGSNVNVGIYDGDPTSGGALLGTHDAGVMASGSTVDFTYNWDSTGYQGYYSLCIIPDYLDAISESNENNNIAPVDVYIAPPMDVGAFAISSLVDQATYEWGPRNINANIGNMGTTSQGPFPVKIEINHLGSTTYLLNDDCESGILPGWTPDGPVAPGWDLRANAANSPATSWDFGDGNYGAGPHDYKLEFGPFDLTGAFTSAEWKWFHNYDWEAGWDGGVLDVSADGAAWTRVVSANGYDAALGTGYFNPIDGDAGSDAFTGASGGFVEDSVDLTPWLGDGTVWVRYWAGADDFAGGGTGWNVDDIRISKKTAAGGSLFTDVKDTTLTLGQGEGEEMTWNYDFNDEAEYQISVMTMLPGDAVATNNESVVNIFTMNSMPPGPATDVATEVGGSGGASVYQQTTSDIAVENNGGIIDHTRTHMPVDGTSEQIVEAVTPPTPDTWNNYTVASDMAVEGTVTNDWSFIDENPPTGDTETIEEVLGPALVNIINGESFESAWPAGWTVGGAWTRSAIVTPPYHLTVNAECDPDSGAGDLTTNIMDTSSYDPLQLDFGYIDSGVEAGEGTVWAYTSTAGGTWVQLLDANGAATFTKYSNTWTFGANPEYFWTGFQLEFRLGGAQGNDEWAIDYVWLNGTGVGAPSLEHKWTTDSIPAGYDALNLYVRGLSSNPADDVFSVFWSNDDVSYADTGINIDQAGMSTYPSYSFPLGESGVLYIQVIDDNTGDAVLTTCEIDSIRLEWYENTATPASYSLEHQWQFEDVTAADSHTFHAFVGWDGAGAGDDTFAYYGSATGAFAGEEFLMFTDTTAAIDEYTYPLGAGYTGAFYVMVEDTATGDAEDTVYIDTMYVDSATGGLGTANDIVLRWTLSSDDGAGADDVIGYDIYKADAAVGNYYEGAYVLETTIPAGTNNFIDTNEALDPENCWYYVVATDGTYDSVASGIVSKFDTLPAAINVLANGVTPLSISIGTGIITLTADILDNTTIDENVFPFLIGAEWFDTTDPGVGLANAIASPIDVFWDGPLDSISVVIDTSSWGAGDHIVSVRGRSPNGWGPVTTVTVTVSAPEYLIPVVAGWNLVSLPLLPGDTSLPNALMDIDGDTTWNMFHHYDGAAAYHWKTYNSAFPGLNHNYVDEEMGAWIFVDTVGDGFIKVTGTDPSGTTINLVAGWNMVGFPSQVEGYTAGDLKTDSGGLVTSVERFNGAAAYDIEVMPDIDQFQIGEGYWVFSTGAYIWTIP